MRRFLKTTVFAALVVLTLVILQQLFLSGTYTGDKRVARDNHASFRNQDENTLDVVYVGASNVYSFWQAPLAWDSYGLASQSYANWSMPPECIRYVIQECRKTQPNALYIVNINNFRAEGTAELASCHQSIDDLPLNKAKLEMIETICSHNGFGVEEQLELVFPLFGYHSSWSELKSEDFAPQYADVFGAATNVSHFTTKDVASSFAQRDAMLSSLEDYGPFQESELRKDSLEDLVSYCLREDVTILFVLQPQAITDAKMLYDMRSLCEIVESNGLDLLDISNPYELGLDPHTDYWNVRHTNAHGCIKYTDYLARYIMNNYVIPDRRPDERYSLWSDAAVRYKKYLETKTVFDYEFGLPDIDNSLVASGVHAKNLHFLVRLSWNPVDGVDGYYVYRRLSKDVENPAAEDDLNEYAWTCIATLAGDASSFDDTETYERQPLLPLVEPDSFVNVPTVDGQEPQVGLRYDYAVIPFIHAESGDIYGSYAADVASVALMTTEERA